MYYAAHTCPTTLIQAVHTIILSREKCIPRICGWKQICCALLVVRTSGGGRLALFTCTLHCLQRWSVLHITTHVDIFLRTTSHTVCIAYRYRMYVLWFHIKTDSMSIAYNTMRSISRMFSCSFDIPTCAWNAWVPVKFQTIPLRHWPPTRAFVTTSMLWWRKINTLKMGYLLLLPLLLVLQFSVHSFWQLHYVVLCAVLLTGSVYLTELLWLADSSIKFPLSQP